MSTIFITKHSYLHIPASSGIENGSEDFLNGIFGTSSPSEAHLYFSIIFAVYTAIYVLCIGTFQLRKRLLQTTENGERWYTRIYIPRISKRTEIEPKVLQTETVNLAVPLNIIVTVVLLTFYVTEAVAHSSNISSYGFVGALRYFGSTFSDVCIIALLLVVVKERPGLIAKGRNTAGPFQDPVQQWKDIFDLILLLLSVSIIIIVFGCVWAISPSSKSLLRTSTILGHLQTLIYSCLVLDVVVSSLRLRRVLVKYDLYDKRTANTIHRFISLLIIRTTDYLISYILIYAPHVVAIQYDVLWIVNFISTGTLNYLILQSVVAAYPPLRKSETKTSTESSTRQNGGSSESLPLWVADHRKATI